MNIAEDNMLVSESLAPVEPPYWARWILFGLLLFSYLILQLVIAFPVLLYLFFAGKISLQSEFAPIENAPPVIWMSLIIAGVTAVITVLVAWGWPLLWRRFKGQDFGQTGWLSWQKPQRLKEWLIPVITVPFLLVTAAGVDTIIGSAEVETQLTLFSTPALQVFATLIVTTVVPLAEELIFRGALYNALLLPLSVERPPWLRHILPLIVTSFSFSLIHLFAGFESFASILLITLFSFFLGSLRALTGSVRASVMGHVVWNVIGALALTLANMPGFGE